MPEPFNALIQIVRHLVHCLRLLNLHRLCGGEEPYRDLIHDRDSIYLRELDYSLEVMGARILKTPFRAPRANAYCETGNTDSS